MALSLNRVSIIEDVLGTNERFTWINAWDNIPPGIDKLKFLLECLDNGNSIYFTDNIKKNEVEKRLIEASLWDGENIVGIGQDILKGVIPSIDTVYSDILNKISEQNRRLKLQIKKSIENNQYICNPLLDNDEYKFLFFLRILGVIMPEACDSISEVKLDGHYPIICKFNEDSNCNGLIIFKKSISKLKDENSLPQKLWMWIKTHKIKTFIYMCIILSFLYLCINGRKNDVWKCSKALNDGPIYYLECIFPPNKNPPIKEG